MLVFQNPKKRGNKMAGKKMRLSGAFFGNIPDRFRIKN